MDAQYAVAVQQEWQRLTGMRVVLTPGDLAIIQRWQRIGIPCEVALRGLAEAMAEVPAGEQVHSMRRLEAEVVGKWSQVKRVMYG